MNFTRIKKHFRTCPRTLYGSVKGQQKDTNNNDNNINNIYFILLNKYARENKSNFKSYIQTVSKMKKDENWHKISKEEQLMLMGRV